MLTCPFLAQFSLKGAPLSDCCDFLMAPSPQIPHFAGLQLPEQEVYAGSSFLAIDYRSLCRRFPNKPVIGFFSFSRTYDKEKVSWQNPKRGAL